MLRFFFTNDRPSPVDVEIDAVLEEMRRVGVIDESYPNLMQHLERLNELKAKGRKQPVSSDTIALILGNLAGILLIVAYEQKHVLSSKGFTQIIRPKGTYNTPN